VRAFVCLCSVREIEFINLQTLTTEFDSYRTTSKQSFHELTHTYETKHTAQADTIVRLQVDLDEAQERLSLCERSKAALRLQVLECETKVNQLLESSQSSKQALRYKALCP
jgi:FtsZ-binding cell division protein ZapB